MEIGIATQRVNAASPLYKEGNLPKKETGFSQHLLGFVANQSSELKEVKSVDAPSFLVNLEAILEAGKLEDLGLTQEQLDQLSKVKELDVNQIADILGISIDGIKTLFSELKSVMVGTGSPVDPEQVEDVYEDLLGTLQLLQSALSKDTKAGKSSVENYLKELNGQGQIEGVVKLAKVLDLFARNRDMHVTDSSKAAEVKELVKNIQSGLEGTIPKLQQTSGDWSRILREAYTRRVPEETMNQNPDMHGSTTEKKGIQPVQGTNLHFVLPKAETFSMNLPSTGRSLQYEQFVKEFQNILGKSNMISQPNMSKLLIKLYPEQLGSIRIELLQQNGVMTAKILASTTGAKEMLDSQIHGLKHAFSAQNLNVEKIEISQPNSQINTIDEYPDVDNEILMALVSKLQTAIVEEEKTLSSMPEMEFNVSEFLINFIQQLLKETQKRPTSQNEKGSFELIKLIEVVELIKANNNLLVMEGSKLDLKELLKNIQMGTEDSLPKLLQSSGDWSKVLREAYTRQVPEEPIDKNTDISVIDKKGIQPVQGTNLHFVLPKAETFSMNLPSTGRSLQYEQFVKEFQNILGKSNMITQPNMSKLLIKLYPEQLGSLRIELLQQNGVMTAKILASTSGAKEMLDSQIHGLKHAFSAQNLNVEKIEISQAFTETERQHKGQSGQGSHQHKQSDQPQTTHEEETQSFKDYLVNTEI